LWKDLEKWRQYDEVIAEAAQKKLARHLSYLHGRQVSYAFFSNKVDDDEKEAMAQRLLFFKDQVKDEILWGKPDSKSIRVSADSKLRDFVTEESWLLAQITKIPFSFLPLPASSWKKDPNFEKLRKIVGRMKVVNDCAEHWVKLGTDFAGKNCKAMDDRQAMYQVVERERAPNHNKATRKAGLMDNLNEEEGEEEEEEED
jgi:hypothetical protein